MSGFKFKANNTNDNYAHLWRPDIAYLCCGDCEHFDAVGKPCKASKIGAIVRSAKFQGCLRLTPRRTDA